MSIFEPRCLVCGARLSGDVMSLNAEGGDSETCGEEECVKIYYTDPDKEDK